MRTAFVAVAMAMRSAPREFRAHGLLRVVGRVYLRGQLRNVRAHGLDLPPEALRGVALRDGLFRELSLGDRRRRERRRWLVALEDRRQLDGPALGPRQRLEVRRQLDRCRSLLQPSLATIEHGGLG